MQVISDSLLCKNKPRFLLRVSDTPRLGIGDTHAEKTRKLSKANESGVGALFRSNVISEASVVRPKSGHLNMRIEKEHFAQRGFFGVTVTKI